MDHVRACELPAAECVLTQNPRELTKSWAALHFEKMLRCMSSMQDEGPTSDSELEEEEEEEEEEKPARKRVKTASLGALLSLLSM